MFGAHRPGEPARALVPGPAQKDTNNWAPARRLRLVAPLEQQPARRRQDRLPRRLRHGLRRALLQPADRQRSNSPRVSSWHLINVVDVYPNLLPAGGAARFNPLERYTNSPEDIQNPDSKFWSLSIGREIGDFVVEVGYTGSRGGHGINQIHANPAMLTPEQAALVAATQERERHPQRAGAAGLPAVRHPHARSPPTSGPAGNDVEARSKYNGVYVAACSKRLQPRPAVRRLLHAQPVREQQRRVARRDRDGRLEPASAEHVRLRRRVERLAVRRAEPLRGELPLGDPGPEVGRPQARSSAAGSSRASPRSSRAGRSRSCTGVDSNGDGTTGSDRPNLSGGCGVTWDDDHRSFTNNGCYIAPLGTNNLPLANGLGNGSAPRNTERAAGVLEHRPQPDEAVLRVRRPAARSSAPTRSTSSTRTTTASRSASMNSASFGQNGNNWGRRIVTLSAKFVVLARLRLALSGGLARRRGAPARRGRPFPFRIQSARAPVAGR